MTPFPTFGDTSMLGIGETGTFGAAVAVGAAVAAGGTVVFGVMVTFGVTVTFGVAVAFGFVSAQPLTSARSSMTARIYTMTLFNALPPIEIHIRLYYCCSKRFYEKIFPLLLLAETDKLSDTPDVRR
jgi:hypothetical protein